MKHQRKRITMSSYQHNHGVNHQAIHGCHVFESHMELLPSRGRLLQRVSRLAVDASHHGGTPRDEDYLQYISVTDWRTDVQQIANPT